MLTPVITLVGFFMARRVAPVVDVEVPLADLPPQLEGFTIAQISDIHVGPTIKRNFVEAIVDRVNRLSADMVAITGDVVDGSVRELAHHTEPLGGSNRDTEPTSSRVTTSTIPALTRGSTNCGDWAHGCC